MGADRVIVVLSNEMSVVVCFFDDVRLTRLTHVMVWRERRRSSAADEAGQDEWMFNRAHVIIYDDGSEVRGNVCPSLTGSLPSRLFDGIRQVSHLLFSASLLLA